MRIPGLVAALAAVLALAVSAMSAMSAARPLRKNPTWDIQTKVEPDARAGGWYINLGITGARGKIDVETPTVMEVTYVFEGTPARGRLEVGDRIVGANGEAFQTPHRFGYGMDFFGYEGPMMDLGNALEASQGDRERGGVLALDVVRSGERVQVDVPVGTKYGAYSASYPFACAKTDAVLEEAYAYLARRQGDDGHWHRGRAHIDVFAALALLASGDDRYRTHAERAARAFAAATGDRIGYEGLDCWKYTLYAIYLAEYHLATEEAWVLPELEEIDRWLRQAQMEDGGWGHRPAHRPGGNGYGAFAAMTAQAKLAWSLMMRCGIAVDADRYQAAHEFLLRGTNEIGYLWYADGIGHPSNYADMGRTGTSALAHLLGPAGLPAYRETALRHARCIGDNPATFPDTHGSPVLGMAFTALGAAADPAALRRLLDHNRWSFSLAHCPDGTFYYQPNRDNNPQDYAAAPRLSATAASALILSIGRGSLEMTREARPVDDAPDAGGRKVKVFLLAGQSNMEGKGAVNTLPWLGEDPEHGHLLEKIRAGDGDGDGDGVGQRDGWVTRDDVFIWYLGRHGPLGVGYGSERSPHGLLIGPEYGFGNVVGDFYDEPVLLIKTAWGGKDVANDFRAPGSGGPGVFYAKMIAHARDVLAEVDGLFPGLAGREPELEGFVWFQGWNDMVSDEKTAAYTENLAQMIRDLRKDLDAPGLPVVIGELGANGDRANEKMLAFRRAQRAVAELPEFAGSVSFVRTAPYYDRIAHDMFEQGVWEGPEKERFYRIASDRPYHYLGSGKIYYLMGWAFGRGMLELTGE